MPHTLSLFLAILIAKSAFAQTSLTIAKVTYSIPTLNLTKLGAEDGFMLEDSLLQANHFIKPITASKYDFELRCMYYENVPFNWYRLIIIKANKRNIEVEDYLTQRVAIVAGNGPKIITPYAQIAITNHQHDVAKSDSLFNKLVRAGLFTLTGSQTDYKTKTSHFYHYDKVLFQVKLNDQYRYFLLTCKNVPRSQKLKVADEGQELFKTVLKAAELEKRFVD